MTIGINTDFAGAWALITQWIWLILPLVLLHTILFIFALISILRKDLPGSAKLPWILLAFLVQTFGPIIYFVVGSGLLDKKIAQREDREW